MKKVVIIFIIISGIALVSPQTSFALTSTEALKGRILIQVESKGEIWYVSPSNLRRYPMRTPEEALQTLRAVSVGIRDADLDQIPSITDPKNGNGKLRQRLAGRFLLAVERKGEIWYVHPTDLVRRQVRITADRGATSLLLRDLGVGVANSNLARIAGVKSEYDARIAPKQVSGMILLDVQGRGQAWYVYPADVKTIWKRLRRQQIDVIQNAHYFLRDNARGIESIDLLKIPHFESSMRGDIVVRRALAGHFLLAVDDSADTQAGDVWYVSPRNLKRYPMRISHWHQDFWRAGIGISENNLSWIPRL